MHSLFTFTSPAHECHYLPDQTAKLHYEIVRSITDQEYQRKLEEGWRHFGHSLFRPQCHSCRACQSIRVIVDEFRPNRSQRRAWRDNQDIVVTVGEPSVSAEKLRLYDRFHAYQTDRLDWPMHLP